MRIVIAWHGTERSEAALDAALDGYGPHAEVVLVRAVTVAADGDGHPDPGGDHRRAAEDLERRVAALRTAGHQVAGQVLRGLTGAADQLLRYLEREPADLLVCGVRRRSPVGKVLLGSVSQSLLLAAPCDVLAVKAPKDR